MRKQFIVQLAVAAAFVFGHAANLLARNAPPVTETPQGNGTTQYTLTNNFPSGPVGGFDIGLFLSTTTGDTPTTTNSTWTAESVTAGTWGSPMGTSLASWQQYTG
jgi:hypothetical protein